MKKKIIPTIMFIVMVFTYLMVSGQAVTAQQPNKVEQNSIYIVDSLAAQVDGLCYGITHPSDSIYSQEFLDSWREELEGAIQFAVINYVLTPEDLFQIMEPMHEMNVSYGYSMDMDCAINIWHSFPESYVEEFWNRYFLLTDNYYKK